MIGIFLFDTMPLRLVRLTFPHHISGTLIVLLLLLLYLSLMSVLSLLAMTDLSLGQ